MDGATPVYNGNKTLDFPSSDFPFIEYLLDSVYKKIRRKDTQ